jgi:UPF0042 nucleotide-binding protein
MLSPNNRTGVLVKVTITTVGTLHTDPHTSYEDGLFVDLSNQLRNPADDPAMRHLTGLDKKVADHVLGTSGAMTIVERIAVSAKGLLDSYADKRHQLVKVTIACRGGRHRSVAIAEAVAQYLRGEGIGVEVDHLHIERPVVEG